MQTKDETQAEDSGFFYSIPEPFSHQEKTKQFGLINPRVFDMSDAGTGKTRAWLEVLRVRFNTRGGRALVIAPKTILKSAWADDIRKFTPELTYVIARANNRIEAFTANVQIYITNHDAVKWLLKNRKEFLDGRDFHSIIIDESTAFKHRTSQRSKALAKLVIDFENRTLLTGTPNPNGLLDLWHQVFLLDDGQHLGSSYWKYRSTVSVPTQKGPSPQHIQWTDGEGAAEAVASIIEDITIRNVFEECIDIPANHEYSVSFELNPEHRAVYELLKEHAVLELENGGLSAFNKGILATKLLQMASGAVYDDQTVVQLYTTDRYNLVLDLVEQRDQCVVAYNWTHQCDNLVRLATERGLSFGVINGSVSDKRREKYIEQFQSGLLRIIFAHPASAAHGLTLTRGTTTIWASPVATANAEHFVQFNKRIYRAGQTRKTETLIITATDTLDEFRAEQLMNKVTKMSNLLEMLA